MSSLALKDMTTLPASLSGTFLQWLKEGCRKPALGVRDMTWEIPRASITMASLLTARVLLAPSHKSPAWKMNDIYGSQYVGGRAERTERRVGVGGWYGAREGVDRWRQEGGGGGAVQAPLASLIDTSDRDFVIGGEVFATAPSAVYRANPVGPTALAFRVYGARANPPTIPPNALPQWGAVDAEIEVPPSIHAPLSRTRSWQTFSLCRTEYIYNHAEIKAPPPPPPSSVRSPELQNFSLKGWSRSE